MKIEFTQILHDLDGKTIENVSKRQKGGPERGPDMRLGDICIEGLLSMKQDAAMTGDTKLKQYTLAALIKDSMKPDAKPPNFVVEDVVLLKQVVADFFMPLISGQCWLMLEGRLPEQVVTDENK